MTPRLVSCATVALVFAATCDARAQVSGSKSTDGAATYELQLPSARTVCVTPAQPSIRRVPLEQAAACVEATHTSGGIIEARRDASEKRGESVFRRAAQMCVRDGSPKETAIEDAKTLLAGMQTVTCTKMGGERGYGRLAFARWLPRKPGQLPINYMIAVYANANETAQADELLAELIPDFSLRGS